MARELRPRLYAVAFFEALGPIYAVYPLWFADHGLSTADISLLYVMWAALVILLEIPSGALADRLDRRRLIAFAYGLRAVGISIWMAVPGWQSIFLGAVLWAIEMSLTSGAWEALIYDELAAHDDEEAYAEVVARADQFETFGIAFASASAFVLLAASVPMVWLGWATVALHIPVVALVLWLPKARMQADEDDEPNTFSAWWSTLTEGIGLAWSDIGLRRLLVLGALLEGLFILDEYAHLLGRLRGASDVVVPLLVLGIWAGMFLGSELAARRPHLSPGILGGLLSSCACVTVFGLVLGTVPGLALLGVVYAALQTTSVLSDARFQEKIDGSVRATVSSVRSFFSGLVNMAAFAGIGLLAVADDPTPGLLIVLAILVGLGGLVWRWVPRVQSD